MEYILSIFIFVFGLLVGSFLNVVIYRVPRNLSVVLPRSSCTNCGSSIKWYQNIPIFSFIFLKGRCHNCKVKISVKYPFIELFCGLIAILLYRGPETFISSQIAFEFIYYYSIACVFLAHFLIDIEHKLLPDKLNLYLLAIVLPYSVLNRPLWDWLLGGIFGFGGPYLITYIFYKLKGQIGLGGGDIKLFGILGIMLGVSGVIQNIFLSSTLGAVIGILLIISKKMNRDTTLAFGPYIIIVATVQVFLPDVAQFLNPFTLR